MAALDAFLLINLRLASSGAMHRSGQSPWWFVPVGFLLLALITCRMFSALSAVA